MSSDGDSHAVDIDVPSRPFHIFGVMCTDVLGEWTAVSLVNLFNWYRIKGTAVGVDGCSHTLAGLNSDYGENGTVVEIPCVVTRTADLVLRIVVSPVVGSRNLAGSDPELRIGASRMAANECDESGNDSAFDHSILACCGGPHGRFYPHHGDRCDLCAL